MRAVREQFVRSTGICFRKNTGQVPLTDLEAVIVSEIRAAQEQALQAKYHATKVLQTETQSKV